MAESVDSPWKLIAEFNRTAREFPADVTLHELFERQALRNGSRRAVLCHHDPFWGEPALTFAQLNEKANQVARRLQESGVRQGDIVGLLTERSFAMVIGVFGILKAGAAYLPLSPDDPTERLAYVLADAGVKTLLVHRATAGKAPPGPVIVDLESAELYAGPGANLGRISVPRDL